MALKFWIWLNLNPDDVPIGWPRMADRVKGRLRVEHGSFRAAALAWGCSVSGLGGRIRRQARRRRVWEKTDGICAYCGTRMHPFGTLTMDHVVPRCKGGPDTIDNLVPACQACNSEKGNGHKRGENEAI